MYAKSKIILCTHTEKNEYIRKKTCTCLTSGWKPTQPHIERFLRETIKSEEEYGFGKKTFM